MGNKYIKTEEKFINPYHFIPLIEEGCSRGFNKKDLEKDINKYKYTGKIRCSLKTMTPIFIPNSSNNKTFTNIRDSNSYDFFSYENLVDKKDPLPPEEPIIPGCEIRGVIRNSYEALTNSCLSTTDIDKITYYRFPKPKKPGILYYNNNNKWYIQPCNYFKVDLEDYERHFKDLEEGESINYQGETGYLHHGEPFGEDNGKNYEYAFYEINENPICVNELYVYNLYNNLQYYRDSRINNGLNSFHQGYEKIDLSSKDFESWKNKERILIYYQKIGNHYYLDFAQIGRIIFRNKIKDVIKDYHPCDSPNNLCSGCFLFGNIGKDGINEYSVSSRIRFTDAKSIKKLDDSYYLPPGYLPELSTPKISSFEFYLKKPENNIALWTYDFAIKKWRGYNNYELLREYNPRINGRKFYWHSDFNQDNYESIENVSDRNIYVRPLEKGIEFEFYVYFKNISKLELKQLIWTLEIGGNKECGHKLGMGKPLGLGSVQISVQNLFLRKIFLDFKNHENSNLNYIIQENTEIIQKVKNITKNFLQKLKFNEKVVEIYKKINNFQIKENIEPNIAIEYPNNTNSDDIFEWFKQNREVNEEASAFKPLIVQNLDPLNILTKEFYLYKYGPSKKKKIYKTG